MYTDLLTKIQNGQRARKEFIRVPLTRGDLAVVDVLAAHGYLESRVKKGRLPKRTIEIKLRYAEGKGAIRGVRFLSTPSRRRYAGYRDLKPVRQGYGLGVISTSAGIMATAGARRRKLGGELLFEVW